MSKIHLNIIRLCWSRKNNDIMLKSLVLFGENLFAKTHEPHMNLVELVLKKYQKQRKLITHRHLRCYCNTFIIKWIAYLFIRSSIKQKQKQIAEADSCCFFQNSEQKLFQKHFRRLNITGHDLYLTSGRQKSLNIHYNTRKTEHFRKGSIKQLCETVHRTYPCRKCKFCHDFVSVFVTR